MMKKDWKYKKLLDVCDFQGGAQPPKSEWVKEPQNGYVRMLQIRDFTQSREAAPEYVKLTNKVKTCSCDDIMVGRYGASVGKILTGLAGAYNVALMKTLPNKDFLIKPYLRFYLLSNCFQGYLMSLGGRAAQAGFSKDDLANLSIALPSLSEQKKIVEYLDSSFAKIDTLKANAAKNLDEAKALFQSALKEALEPKKGWEEKTLKEITNKIGSGATPKGGKKVYIDKGCSLIRSMNVHYNTFKYDELAHINDYAAEQLKGVEIKSNDVLFNITGASIARCCIVPDDILPARVNQHVSILRLKDGILPTFLCYTLISPNHQKKLLKIGEAGSTRQALTKGDLGLHKIGVPSLQEQQEIVSRLDSLNEKVNTLQQNYSRICSECDALKQSILRQVFE